jgi:hypothetical protein
MDELSELIGTLSIFDWTEKINYYEDDGPDCFIASTAILKNFQGVIFELSPKAKEWFYLISN